MDELSQLIEDCIANKRLSQEKIYRRFYPSLFLLCKQFFKDDHQAMEALNDGMLKVFKNISGYQFDKGRFFNWMYTIVRNSAIDKIKSKTGFLHIEQEEPSQLVSTENILKTLEWKDIYQLLDQLTPATRAVCSLFYLEEYSIQEIAQNLDLSIGTVKWHLFEARKKLKPILQKHYLS